MKAAKEQELAMWRRRASYDPMKAAMEGKKRQEEAKRILAQQQQQQQSKLPERCAVFDMCCFATNTSVRTVAAAGNPRKRFAGGVGFGFGNGLC